MVPGPLPASTSACSTADRLSRAWIFLFAAAALVLLLGREARAPGVSSPLRARPRPELPHGAFGSAPTPRREAIAESIRAHRFWGYRIAGWSSPTTTARRRPRSAAFRCSARWSELPAILRADRSSTRWGSSPSDRRDFDRFEDLVRMSLPPGAGDPHPLRAQLLPAHPGQGGARRARRHSRSSPSPRRRRAPSPSPSSAASTIVLPRRCCSCSRCRSCWRLRFLVRASSSGAVLFRQTRCGLNGRLFTLYKFRTMSADAEERRAEAMST